MLLHGVLDGALVVSLPLVRVVRDRLRRLRRHLLLLVLWRLLHFLLKLLDASLDPGVAEGILRRHSLIGLPLEALVDEVHEVGAVICLHHLTQSFRVNVPELALRVGLLEGAVVVVEENFPA